MKLWKKPRNPFWMPARNSRKAAFTSDAQRVEFLFERYQQITSLLPAEATKTKRRKKN